MTGKTKIELILELKNKIKSGLSEARTKLNSDVGFMKAKLAELKMSVSDSMKDLQTQIPALGTAMKILKNPITIAAAAAVGLYKGFDALTKRAADFNTQFRQLSMLNLEKPKAEMDSLKKIVRDTAFDKGFDTEKTIAGFAEVQSTTGKYGAEVQAIVAKQGEFARLMQADFNSYIAGTAKAMINFGFGAERLDEFNRSAYATMQVGVITFDELSKVQSVYSGAAASAMQDFDAANKMLALFTVKTKSVNVAATLTKSLFNDLTKSTTINAFKKVGIDAYDASGKLKQVDKLILELNEKFRGLDSDRKIIELKNQFSGSEGLIALVQAATDQTGQLQITLDEFDKAGAGFNRVFQDAKEDLNYINETLKNKTNALLTEYGESMLPTKIWWNRLLQGAVKNLMWLTGGLEDTERRMAYNEGGESIATHYGGYLDKNKVSSYTPEEYNNVMNLLKGAYSDYDKLFRDNPTFTDREFYRAGLEYLKNAQTTLPQTYAESQYGSVSNWKDVSHVVNTNPVYPVANYDKSRPLMPNRDALFTYESKSGGDAAFQDLQYLKDNLMYITKEQSETIFNSIATAATKAMSDYKTYEEKNPQYAAYMYGWGKEMTTFLETFNNLWGGATNWGANVRSFNPGDKNNNTNNTDDPPPGNLGDSVTSVTGSAKQIRNITVNIDAFNKGGINTQNTSLQKMDGKQIEEWFIDTCYRAIRNVEMSYC